MKISVKIQVTRSAATDEYESYLIISRDGRVEPYLFIPDGFDDEILDEIINRIKTGNGTSY